MNFLNKMERKFGRYAIHNLTAIIIGLYVAGYLLYVISPNILNYLTLEPYYILHGQVWRVVTWLIVPPSSLNIFTVIMLFFYFSIGRTLEQTWGAFRYNVYIFSGMIFTVVGAIVLYLILLGTTGYPWGIGSYFSTYYVNMSIFLAFAVSYPDMQVLLYFIIPVKMKWMGLLYAVLILAEFIQGGWPQRVAILCSLLNFLIYFLMTRNAGGYSASQRRARAKFRQATNNRNAYRSRFTGSSGSGSSASAAGARKPIHRCTVCGRTELDDPNLVFRYCSKCDGAYEYCQDHLFNHKHIKAGQDNT